MLGTARRRLQERVDEIPFWWHSIDLGHGVVAPVHKPPAVLRDDLDGLALPDLRGRAVVHATR